MKFRFHARVTPDSGSDVDEITVNFTAPTWPAAERRADALLHQIGLTRAHLGPGYSITYAPASEERREPIDARDRASVEVVKDDRSGAFVAVRLVLFEVDPETGAKSVKDIMEWDLGTSTLTSVSKSMERFLTKRCADVVLLQPDGFVMPPRMTRLSSMLLAI